MGFAALLLLPYWLVQGLRHGKYLSNLGQRLGFSFPSLANLPADRPGAIWLHAVSVGEALSGVTLARRLKAAYPDRPLIVSTMTTTGQALARERMPFADAVIYFPLDWTFCVRRAMNAVRPSVVLILETEIWPNFLREARRQKVPVLFLSGRISDRSFARYQSYLSAFGFFLRPFLKDALSNASGFLMQGEKDAERIRALGAPADRVFVSGNLKYDLELPAPTPLSNWLKRRLGVAAARQSSLQAAWSPQRNPSLSSRLEHCKGSIPKRSWFSLRESRNASKRPPSSSTNRIANSSAARSSRSLGHRIRMEAPRTARFRKMLRSFWWIASANSPLSIALPMVCSSAARWSRPVGTIFSNPRPSGKFPCSVLRWRISRRSLRVSSPQAPPCKWRAPKMSASPGLSFSMIPIERRK